MTRIILRALNTPILIFFVAIAIAIQTSLFASWPLMYFEPDLVLLAVIWCALRRGFGEGGIITLIVSEISELHTAAPQGVHLVSYMSIYLLVRASSKLLDIPSLFSYTTVTLVTSILWKLTGLFILYLLSVTVNPWKHTLTYLFIGAAVDATISIWIYRWLEKFDWITFKNSRAEQITDEDLVLDSEGV